MRETERWAVPMKPCAFGAIVNEGPPVVAVTLFGPVVVDSRGMDMLVPVATVLPLVGRPIVPAVPAYWIVASP